MFKWWLNASLWQCYRARANRLPAWNIIRNNAQWNLIWPRAKITVGCSFSQTVSTASELRKPIYWIVAAKAIDYEQMLLLMSGVKWDIKEIMSQHNIYVDVLLKVRCDRSLFFRYSSPPWILSTFCAACPQYGHKGVEPLPANFGEPLTSMDKFEHGCFGNVGGRQSIKIKRTQESDSTYTRICCPS